MGGLERGGGAGEGWGALDGAETSTSGSASSHLELTRALIKDLVSFLDDIQHSTSKRNLKIIIFSNSFHQNHFLFLLCNSHEARTL